MYATEMMRESLRMMLAGAFAALVALISGCASLPSLEGRARPLRSTDTGGDSAWPCRHPRRRRESGQGRNPRASRSARRLRRAVLLAAAAEKSLDAQYYIWHGDQVGLSAVRGALAGSGARRARALLLDDLNTRGLDPTIAALDAHPNIEVRLYNPVVQRDARALNFVTDFTRVNHRMHNKSFTADNQVSVVGGRNIGNEYFGAGTGSGSPTWT